jgi:hypothetical protein
MHASAVVHLELELDATADPVEGCLVMDGGGREPFVGWIQLAAALERLRVGAGAPEPAGAAD